MCFASGLFCFILLFHFLCAQIQSWPEVTDWQVRRQKLALFVPFTQVTLCKLCSACFLPLLFPLVDLSLNVLGLFLGLVGCLDFCASPPPLMSQLAQYCLSQSYLGLKQEHLVFPRGPSCNFHAPSASADTEVRKQRRISCSLNQPQMHKRLLWNLSSHKLTGNPN